MRNIRLNKIAVFILFVTSYIPLFVLLIIRQVKQNILFLNYGGFSKASVLLALENFGLSYVFVIISFLSFIGLRLLLNNLDCNRNNGELVKVVEVENKNSETIGYISTYIIPFIFQDTNNLFDLVSILLVLTIIFFIYSKSNMIVINPILSITHTLYQVEFSKKGKRRKGLLITREEDIETDQEIKINQITKSIYYG